MTKPRKSAPLFSDEESVDAAAVETEPPPAEEKPKEPQKPVDLVPRFTAKQMFRGAGPREPLKKAFLHVEGLNQKRTRKLTQEEWEAEFKRFCEAERR